MNWWRELNMGWYNASWSHRIPITIDHDKVGVTQDLASNAASVQKDVVVQKGSVYGVGDSVVIKDSGNRETGTVASVAGDTVTLVGNLTNAYTTANKAFLKNVTDSTDSIDFPVLINEHDLPSSFWTNVKADGSDIVVTSSNGTTKLKRELVAGSWSRAGETMELHVKVPTLSNSSDDVLYIYYGNAAGAETNDTEVWERTDPATFTNNTGIATGSPISRTLTTPLTIEITQAGTFDVVVPTGGVVYVKRDTATVTDSPVTLTSNDTITVEDTGNITFIVGGYVAVHHMNDSPDTSHIADSTSNNNDGTKKGANEPVEVAGLVSKAQDFDGSDDYITAPIHDFAAADDFTIETMINPHDNAGEEHLVEMSGIQFWRSSREVIYYENGYCQTGLTVLTYGVNNYITLVREGSGDREIFVDGVSEASNHTDTLNNPGTTLVIGILSNLNAAYCYTGKQDEVRISDIARTPSHISTTNNTLMSPATFYSVGEVASIWVGKISGVTNPTKIMGVGGANIASVKGVA